MTYRVAHRFTGLTGAPYLNVMHFSSTAGLLAQDAADAATGFWLALSNFLKLGMQCVVEPVVTTFDPATGDVTAFTAVSGSPITFSEAGESLPFASQALVRLQTAGVVHNRNVKGRIFVPGLTQGALDNGVLLSSTSSAIDTAAEAMISDTASVLAVWSRPVEVATPQTPIRSGSEHIVTAASVAAQFAVLRGRRD